MRSMRRAIQGGVGHGEVLMAENDENHFEATRKIPQWENITDSSISSIRARL